MREDVLVCSLRRVKYEGGRGMIAIAVFNLFESFFQVFDPVPFICEDCLVGMLLFLERGGVSFVHSFTV